MLLTGLGGLMRGRPTLSWVLWLHGIGAYAVIVVLLWKARIILTVLRRRPALTPERLVFLLLTGLLLAVLATGYVWTWAGRGQVGGFSLMVVHGTLATVLVGLLLWHVLARRVIFRVPAARDRRAVLRLAGAGLGGLLLWRVADGVRQALALPGAARRFTGSYETGSLTGEFPETIWLFDTPPAIDPAHWRLTIGGAVERPVTLGYAEVLALGGETVAEVLDCTGGWYSTQAWTGVRLARLLALTGPAPAARSVTVESATGYSRRFALAAAGELLLATAVAGAPLSQGHGAPARLVAPGYRGYDWVKWVVRLQVDVTDARLQAPLPLQ